MSNPINKSGTSLEARLEVYLIENNIQYKKQTPGKHEIDFKIYQPDGVWYVECTNQNVNGSVCEKLPHKQRKYYRLYKKENILKRYYHVVGEFILPKSVIITMDEDAVTYDYDYIIDNGLEKFVSRLDGTYNYNPLGI
jgi:hypothetical protein